MRLIMPMLLGAALFVSGLVPQTPPDAPAARGGHAMTYDSHHGLALMFGGGSRQQSFNDLWAWNGKRWQRLAESGPSPRDSATFAYDSKRNRAIVVGGRSLGALVDDTWEWDGTLWREQKVSGPGLRLHHFAAFDARRERLVLYGGLKPIDKTVERLTDTWEWDGATWTRRDTEGFAAFPSSIAYDEARGQVVVIAVDATTPPDGERPSAMWAWDGSKWSRVSAAFGEPSLSPSQPLSTGPRRTADTRRRDAQRQCRDHVAVARWTLAAQRCRPAGSTTSEPRHGLRHAAEARRHVRRPRGLHAGPQRRDVRRYVGIYRHRMGASSSQVTPGRA